MVLLAMLAVIGADGLGIWNARRQTVAAAQTETTNLARSLAEIVRGDFGVMDTILVGLRERVMHDGTGPAALQRLRAVITTRLAALPMVHSMLILDANGRLLVSGDGILTPGMNMAGSATFIHHRDDRSLDMFVSPPMRNILDGRWVIKLSRRVQRDDGSFAGVVITCVTTDFFQALFGSYDIGRNGAITLARREGIALARNPGVPNFVGSDISRSPLFMNVTDQVEHATYEGTSPIDGTRRLGSFHKVAGTPVIVMVGRSKHAILAGWRIAACLHLLGLCLVLIIMHELGRRLAHRIAANEQSGALLQETVTQLTGSKASLTTANKRLEMAEQIAQLGHWHVDCANGGALTWSDEVYRIHGYDRVTFVPNVHTGINAYHPDDRGILEKAFTRTLETGVPFHLDLRLIRADGAIRNVRMRAIRQTDASGAAIAIFGVFMDVTEQKEAERLLLKAQAEKEVANEALAVANGQLQAMALQDALTGIANRRHFDMSLDREFRHTQSVAGSLSLILFDVDHFKLYNDSYGHQAGDTCLRAVAEAIAGYANRSGEIACRYGGEEMALLLPQSNGEGAVTTAMRVTQAIRDLAIPHAATERGIVTVSAGIATFVYGQSMYFGAELVANADQALYAAKHGGRDRAVVYRAERPRTSYPFPSHVNSPFSSA